ncbi:MAG TPA: DUF2752 domain-containing protein [Bacteroidales bacterium]|nr:DUF2752 domain-containing protein [Bacteroidales bacterium]
MITRKKLYILLSVALLAGYILLFVEIFTHRMAKDVVPDLCIFKTVTGLPCPACGSTRSVLSLFDGNVAGALRINPLGFVIVLVLLAGPVWLSYDIISRRKTLYDSYLKAENILRKPFVAAPLIVLLLINWAWNIAKGL